MEISNKIIWLNKLTETLTITEKLFSKRYFNTNHEIDRLILEVIDLIRTCITTYEAKPKISENEILEENDKIKLKCDYIKDFYTQSKNISENKRLLYDAQMNIFNEIFSTSVTSDNINKSKEVIKDKFLFAQLNKLAKANNQILILNSLNAECKITFEIKAIMLGLINLGFNISTEYSGDSSETAIRETIKNVDFILILGNSYLYDAWHQYNTEYTQATPLAIAVSTHLTVLYRMMNHFAMDKKVISLILDRNISKSLPPFILKIKDKHNIEIIKYGNVSLIAFLKSYFIAKNDATKITTAVEDEFNTIDSLYYKNNTEENLTVYYNNINQKIMAEEPSLPSPRYHYNSTIFDVGTRNSDFFGRNRNLKQIHDFFESSDQKLQEAKVFVLTGRKGCGKSQIAKEYAWLYKDEYQYVFTLKNNSLEEHLIEILEIVKNQKISFKQLNELFKLFMDYLSTIDNWLIIFDDNTTFSEIASFIPKKAKDQRGHVIACVNSADNCNYTISTITNFEKSEAFDYVKNCLSKNHICATSYDFVSINELCQELNYYPYNLALAIAFLQNNPNLTIAHYLAKLKTSSLTEHEELALSISKSVDNYNLTTYQILKQTLTAIFRQNHGKNAITLLLCIGLIDANEIEETIIHELLKDKYDFNNEEFYVAIDILIKFHLLEKTAFTIYQHQLLTKRLTSLTPVMGEIFKLRMENYLNYDLSKLFSSNEINVNTETFISNIFEFLSSRFDYSHTNSLEGKVEYVHHIVAFIKAIDNKKDYITYQINLLVRLAEFEYFECRKNDPALRYAQNAIKLLEDLASSKPEEIDPFIKGKAYIYAAIIARELGKIAETASYITTAIKTLDIINGSTKIKEEHKLYLQLLVKRFNGQQESLKCNFTEARNLLLAAKETASRLKKLPGYFNIILEEAIIIGTLARIDLFLGNYPAAFESNERAIDYKKRARKEDDYEVALNYLTSIEILLKTCDYIKAKEYLDKMLISLKSSFGNNPIPPVIEWAVARHKGMYLYAIGELTEASSCFNTIIDNTAPQYAFRAHAHAYLARIELANGNLNAALSNITKSIDIFDNNAKSRGINLFEHAEFYKISTKIYLAKQDIAAAEQQILMANKLLTDALSKNTLKNHPLQIQISLAHAETSANRNHFYETDLKIEMCKKLLKNTHFMINNFGNNYENTLDYADYYILKLQQLNHSNNDITNAKNQLAYNKYINKLESLYKFHFENAVHKLPHHFRYKKLQDLKILFNSNTVKQEAISINIDDFIKSESDPTIIFKTLAKQGYTWPSLKLRYSDDTQITEKENIKNKIMMQKLIEMKSVLDKQHYKRAIESLLPIHNERLYIDLILEKKGIMGINRYKYVINFIDRTYFANQLEIIINTTDTNNLIHNIDTFIEIKNLPAFLSIIKLSDFSWPDGWNNIYDLNKVDLELAIQAAIIYYYNTLSENEFNMSSLTNRDSYLVSDGFINPVGYPKFDYFNLTIEDIHEIGIKEQYVPFKLIKQQLELAASLLPIYEYFVLMEQPNEWTTFISELINEWNKLYSDPIIQKKFADSFLSNSTNLGISNHVKNYYNYKTQQLEAATKQMYTLTESSEAMISDIKVRAMNSLYVKHLLKVAEIRFKIVSLDNEIKEELQSYKVDNKLFNNMSSSLTNHSQFYIKTNQQKELISDIYYQIKLLANLINEQQDAQIKANLFAPEAYINRSAFYHNIWIQFERSEPLDSKQVIMGSILQQIGFKLLHITHMQQAKLPIGEILNNASKYSARIADMLFENKDQYFNDKAFTKDELKELRYILSRLDNQISANQLEHDQYSLINNDTKIIKKVIQNEHIPINQKTSKTEWMFKKWIYRQDHPKQLNLSNTDIESIQEQQMKDKLLSDSNKWLNLAKKAIVLTYNSKLNQTNHLWGETLSHTQDTDLSPYALRL